MTPASVHPRAGLPDRALGALTGLAVGDALGMPSQMMSRPEVLRRFGVDGVTGFEAAADDHPLAAGMPAGAVTMRMPSGVLMACSTISDSGAWSATLQP